MRAISRRITDGMSKMSVNDDRSPATRNATPSQQKLAQHVALWLIAIATLTVPFASVQLPMFQAFFPSYQTAVIMSYLVTTYLMLGQYKATHTKSLLYLGAGSLFTAGILLLQLLAFPGAFLEKGQLIGGSQTLTWLWFFWHAGPALGILFFAYSELKNPGEIAEKNGVNEFHILAITAVSVFATALLVTVFHDSLPVMDIKGDYSRITSSGIAPGLEVLLLIALGALWLVSGFKKVMHIWLGLTLVALLCDNAITMLGGSRLSLGWYVGRLGALISAIVVPLVYLQEIKQSYVRAAVSAEKLSEENTDLAIQVDISRHDSLTGLPGRTLFMERSTSLLAAKVAANTGFATLFIDLDGFKQVNDRLGHDCGNDVLKRVAEILHSELRTTDVAGRLGGDEFAVCLDAPAELSLDIAINISERIIDKIGAIGNGIGASIGISLTMVSLDLALNEADEAMYYSKKNGKNRSSLYRTKPNLAFSA